jgi:hypothetical protein
MATATPQDYKKNEAIAHAMVDNEPISVSGQVGLHALGKLAELMPHEEFSEFLNDAVQAATTGQQPPEDSETQETK